MKAYLAALTLAVLAVALPAHAQLLSPGELARVHGELDSDADCTRCHASGRGVEARLCHDCHDDIGRQRSRGEGLHGTRFKRQGCGYCHVEHRGRDHDLIRWPDGDPRGFDHGWTGFELRHAHAEAPCRDCHTRRNRRSAPTFLGLSAGCSSCHADEDVHDGRFGATCADCHTERRWADATLKRVDHVKTRFALRGAHREVDCAGCHLEPPRYRNLEFGSCGSCHQDPHLGRLGERCQRCHVETGWDDLTMKRSSHPGLRITGGHARVGCRACHDLGLLEKPSRGERCVSCHRAVHEARFGKNCGRCHGRIRWLGLPDALGRKVHHLTAFPLAGEHETVACEDCHLPKAPRAARYRGVRFEQCGDCHADPHGGTLSSYGDGDCTSCHDVHGFRPTLFSVEQHAEAAFPLQGRHVAVPCNGCHRIEPPRLDWTVDHQACADCHENPHGDQFASEMAQNGCASCHNSVAWNVPNIDHSTWPLTGTHEVLACAACHEPTEADRRAGTGASYRGVPRDCEGCHWDPHQGQFRLSEPVRACNFCHDTAQFPLERFDHAAVAVYPLQGEHAKVGCEGCHPMVALHNGEQARRYRLGYRRCADCHADPHVEAGP